MLGSWAASARQLADDPPPGRRSAGVHDPAGAVAAFEAEREVAVPVGVEPTPSRGEVLDRVRRLAHEYLGGAESRTASRPAASVSARCRSGLSAVDSAAASPPWAQ